MNATQNSIHDFEKAGLGKAPFRIIGVSDKVGPISWVDQKTGVTHMVGSPGQPMGVCKFCGEGIQECWSIKSADGKVFDVGCDCVRKTGDAGMKKVVDAHKSKVRREKTAANGKAAEAYLDEAIANHAERLAALPHPMGFADKTTGKTLSMFDWVVYMRKACGAAKLHKIAKTVREATGLAVPV